MLTLTVTRIECNLSNGQKKKREVFKLTHKYSRVANDILQFLLDSGSLEGGDVVTCQRGNKIVRQFVLCNICCKQPTITNGGSSCSDCITTVSGAIRMPAHNDKVVNGIIQTLLSRQASETKKKVVNGTVEKKTESAEQYSSGFSFLQNSFK